MAAIKKRRAAPPVGVDSGLDYRVITILLWCALGLTLLANFSSLEAAINSLRGLGLYSSAERLAALTQTGMNAELTRLSWWSFICIAIYAIVPVALVKYAFKERLDQYGLSVKNIFHHWRLYAAMAGVMIPVVALASSAPAFNTYYPFYQLTPGEQLWPRFWLWELEYLIQFAALEFFFRGFMVLGLGRQFGIYSVFVSAVPYCMIHYNKPLPEAVGSIVAGVALGLLSYKSRTVVPGIAVHYYVAFSMDILALHQRGVL